MPVLKTPCPECEANLRFTVDGDGDHEVTCLKCGHAFTATLEPDGPPTKAGSKETARAKAPPGKPGKKKAESADEGDAPKKKKKKAGDDGRGRTLLLAGGGAALLLSLGLGLVIYAATRDKNKTVKKGDDPAPAAVQPQVPVAPPVVPPGGAAPAPGTKPGGATGPGPNPGPPPPPNKAPEDAELATLLPPPPKIRVSGSLVPVTKPLIKAPAIPPLAPDEDPFVRAAGFKPEGPLPTPPALPKVSARPLLTLDSGGHTGIVGRVFFSAKGDRVITIGEDKAVRFWDPVSNETVKTIRFPAGPGKEGSLQAAAMSRSGKRLAVAGQPLAGVLPGKVPVYVISPETGNQITRLDQGSDAVASLHFSNDGNRLAVGCEDGVVQLFDVASGRELYRTSPHPGASVREVRYNPNPKWNVLASLGTDSTVKLWDFARNATRDLKISGVVPTCLAWSFDGQTLALGCRGGQIMVLTVQGQLLRTLPPVVVDKVPVTVGQVQFVPGDLELAVGGAGNGRGWTGLVPVDGGPPRVTVDGHSNRVSAVDVSADGTRVVSSGGNQHETLVWAAADGAVQHRLIGTGHGVWAVAWAKDGKSIAWGNSNKVENGVLALEHTFRLDEFGVGNPPDAARYTQTVDGDEHVKLLTGTNGFLVKTTGRDEQVVFLPGREPIYSATVLPKGNAVLVGGVESLYLINPATIKVTQTFIGHTGHVLCVTPSPDSRYFATGSSDQTIRIWQRNREEPVLSVFVAGREWIAWTPQGFYACSPQGERLIAWQMNAGAVKFPQVHPAARFRPSMYQPALLKYLIPAGNLGLAMAMAQKFDKALIQTTNVADVLPPEVTLAGFTEGTELKLDKDKGALTVRATATSAKHPITAMRLLVDGRPFQGADGVRRFEAAQPGTPVEATWDLALAPGTHTVAVIADSAVSKGMSKVGVVACAGEVPKPNLYVLAMGVSAYPKGINPLNYSASDAEMIAKAFQEKSKAVFNTIEVKVLTDKSASKKGIREGLDWMKSKITPQDVGIVSFSGHGMRDPFGRFYLVPSDVDPNDEDGATSLSGDEFKARLDAMPGRLVAILDACHSGSVAEKERPPAQADNLVRDLTADDSGVIVMCASLGREYSYENRLTKAGFFTLGLVEGLAGHADIDGDGVVYIHELDMYATARARQLSGGLQNPTLGRPAGIKLFVIAKPDKPVPR